MVEPSSQVKLNCRFYEQKYPSEGDLVQVQVKDIVENGAYVTLTEYDNIEGLITPNEFSKQVNLKNAYKALKVGKTENAIVLKVDQEKGYIDLSKKRVPMEEVKLFEDKVAKAKTVNSILRTVAEKCHTDLDKLYEILVWPLNKKFGNAHDAFKGALTEPDKYFNELAITPDMKSNLCKEIQRRLTPQPVSIRADFSVQYTGYEGVDAIKEALREGEKKSTKGMELKCNVIAAPNYKITLTTSDKAGGIQLVKDALQVIDEVIKSKPGGKFEHNPDKQLQVTGEKEEKTVFSEIQEQIEENKDEESETSENNDEDMGNIDVGVDTEEIDRQEEMKKKSKTAAKDEEDDG